MPPETTGLHVNPSDETIRLGPLTVRFLLTGDDRVHCRDWTAEAPHGL